ncbi:MAG: NAD-dependent epimerase/dehydratase family protein [Bacteroidales bacterium]|jgi:nucleoside-diphosphate-sugar epimerase|nr:NAD-dependent epimerase/dehydratase family protein [Bacteroidales bacterium]
MILVTGGTGLAGSHLLQELTSGGEKVRALRRKSSKTDFVKHVFHAYARDPEKQLKMIEWVEGDVLDIFSLEDAMEGVTKVYHNAAVVSFDPSDRELMYRVNADGTANVVNAALQCGVKKLCHTSSIAALGPAKQGGTIDESTQWVTSKKNSHYAISKFNGEREVWRGTAEGLDAVVILPSIILGLSDISNGSMQLFKTVLKGIPFYTPGMNGYVDARDVAKAQLYLMESNIVNEKFIISAENIAYRETMGLIADGLGKRRPSIKVNPAMALLARYFFKIKSLLTGTHPIVSKETARTAMLVHRYSNEKFVKASKMSFIPVRDTIRNICDIYTKNNFFIK